MTDRDKIERAREVLHEARCAIAAPNKARATRLLDDLARILSEPSAEESGQSVCPECEGDGKVLDDEGDKWDCPACGCTGLAVADPTNTIHSCHANCPRTECVQGRALRKARAARMCQPGSDGWEEAQQAIADALGKAWPPVPGRE